MPSLSEALADKVIDAGALKVWLFVGDVRLTEGGSLVGVDGKFATNFLTWMTVVTLFTTGISPESPHCP